ncbi:malate synthase A [Defluviicoccus vanus]|nr:malate synthase A [Defluviicoccus vanus]
MATMTEIEPQRRAQRGMDVPQEQEMAQGVTIRAALAGGDEDILSPDALAFVAALERRFGVVRLQLLARREEVQAGLDRGRRPGFLAETDHIRHGNWRVAPVPVDLQDRRVEITGPVERKMVINALNSGANVFMADFEDSLTPTWRNLIDGQVNLRDAIAGSITYEDPQTGKSYALEQPRAVLVVRPRGWHLEEAHVRVDGRAMSAALFDFGLYLFHNARTLLDAGSGPYFYLPKLESHLEAKLWADVFTIAEQLLGLPHGSIRVTVLIETILAAFEMEEILYQLRDYAAGLNCGRWDYIFSFIKKFRNRSDCVLPDRNGITMAAPFLHAYSRLLIKTCHRRGAHAIGGMASFIPVKTDAALNEAAIERVRADKLREVGDGHDGTWVAHPGLVDVAKAVFDEHMPGANQVATIRDEVHVTAADLLAVPAGEISEEGLRNNLRVGIQYIEAWLGGLGCVPLYNLMEDAATAEICRSQVWQWLKHKARLADGRPINEMLVGELIDDEMTKLRTALGVKRFDEGHFTAAIALFRQVATPPEFIDFLTLPAYDRVV